MTSTKSKKKAKIYSVGLHGIYKDLFEIRIWRLKINFYWRANL